MPNFFKIGLKFGGFGPQTLIGGPGRDLLFGGFGNDTLKGGGGSDQLFGGGGEDTAVFDGGVQDYTIASRGRGLAPSTVTDAEGAVTRTIGVERLYFTADDYTVDLTGANNAVLARDDSAQTLADSPTVLTGLLNNDFDFDGDSLTITEIDTTGTKGVATLNDDGSITFEAGPEFASLAAGETAETTLAYTVTDGNGSTATAIVTITVTGVNDAPTLTVSDTTIDENTTTVLTAAAFDVDGDDLTFTISGTDAALFVIDPATGALAFRDAPDFEAPADADRDNVYDVTVTATDERGASDSDDVQVTIADITEISAYLNEIHYDNAGTDTGEFIEIAGTAGADLTGWSLVLYNGNGGTPYDTIALTGSLSGVDGTGFLAVPIAGIQNGSPDGFALVDANGTVVEFLSYEGTLTAVGGPADGLTSKDIGVTEGSSTDVGDSLQRNADGTWSGPRAETPGADNDSVAPPPPPADITAVINEFHYDNSGADAGEFVEIAGTAGADLTGWSLVLYNGNDGTPYDTIALTGQLSGTDGTGYLAIDVPGLQNGAPDGLALVRPDGTIVEFLSYEGTFTAVGGPADGMTSTDVGVSEGTGTAVGESLQRNPDNTWSGPSDNTRGASNDPAPLQISELAVSTSGTDWEFAELSGTPGTSLDGLQLLQVLSGGEIHNVVNLTGGAIGETGFYLAASPQAESTFDVVGDQQIANNSFANQSSTFILARANLAIGDDLDANDDGVVDASLTVVDNVALTSGDDPILYSDTVIGPDGDFVPAGVRRQDDGTFAATDFFVSDDYTPTAGSAAPPPPPPPAETVLISTVQGDGDASALTGVAVTVQATVTQLVNNGFYLQEEAFDSDDNAMTSEGVFVFTGGAPTVELLGVYDVTGTVAEFRGATQLTDATWNFVGQGVMPLPVELAVGSLSDVNLEAFEGMQMSFDTGSDAPLTVIENFELARFGEIVISEGIQYQPTQVLDPQDDLAEIQDLLVSNAVNRITVEDGNSAQNPDAFTFIPNPTAGDNGNGYLDIGDDLDQGGTLRLGAELTGPVSGALTEFSGEYKVQTIDQLAIDDATNNGARAGDVPAVDGDLRVVSFNALNYFTSLNERGATSPDDLVRQTEKLVNALVQLDGDIVGLQEVENNGFGDGSAIQTLVDAVNERLGSQIYAVVDPTTDGGRIGTDAITTGMIYKLDSVSVINSDFLVFDDGGTQRNRPTIATAFQDNDGEVVTVAVSHFKSKGGTGSGGDADAGDGQGNFNEIRTDAARQLTDWLASDPLGVNDPDVVLIGDLNAYMQEDPVTAIEDAGYANLLEQYLGSEDAFSFTFDGQRGALDHALASQSLAAQVTGVAEWHINSTEPSLLSYTSQFTNPDWYNGDDPYAASDHDPLVLGLTLFSDDQTSILG